MKEDAQQIAVASLKWFRRYNNITHVVLSDVSTQFASSGSEAEGLADSDSEIYEINEMISILEN